jgi:pimeloyl-ACP methyl ester carboxylesterase
MELPEVRYAKSVGGIDIAWQEFGRTDGPKLVWVSGFISHLDLNWEFAPFATLLRGLGSVCRVIAFDKRGTGLSDRTLGFGSLADRMDDIRAVLDAAGWERSHIFGASEGGPISILFAATYPDRVASLSLYGTGARFVSAPDYPFGEDPETIDLWLEYLRSEWGKGTVLGDGVFLAHPELAPPGINARFERNACTPKMVMEIMSRNVAIDVRDILPTLRVPALVVHATGDPLVRVEVGRYLAEHIPGARFVEVPGEMHGTWRAEDIAVFSEAVLEFVTGERRMVAPERVLATVLFTDIVDSTRQAAERGDRTWRSLLDHHDAESQRLVSSFGGRLVKQTGDGMLATFDGPARAVQCAQELGESLGSGGLAIRAGLHTGEVERRDRDVGGIAVHIAARVASLAGSGEVLVSRTVRDLVVGSDLQFEDRGMHELKGVPDTWQLYAAS